MIPHQSEIMEPLTRVSNAKRKLIWGPEQSTAFEKIHNLLACSVLLSYLNFSKPFDMYTNASAFQLGGIVMQESRPIAFYSRKLLLAQQNYTTMEKELLSVVETIMHHCNILFRFKLQILSDHRNLSFERFQSKRVQCWRLTLKEYNYNFHFLPGYQNIIADCISRFPIRQLPSSAISDTIAAVDKLIFPLDFRQLATEQQGDRNIQHLLRTSHLYQRSNCYSPLLILCKDKIFLPKTSFPQILKWYHESLNHPGPERTFQTISSVFFI